MKCGVTQWHLEFTVEDKQPQLVEGGGASVGSLAVIVVVPTISGDLSSHSLPLLCWCVLRCYHSFTPL